MSKGHPQESSKPKGSAVSVRRRARSWLQRLEEASSTPKRNLEGGGSLEANRDTFRGKSRSSKSDLSPGLETSKAFIGETEGEEGICNANWSIRCVLLSYLNPSRIFLWLGLLSQNFFLNPLFLWFILLVVSLFLRFRWSQAFPFSMVPFLSLLL